MKINNNLDSISNEIHNIFAIYSIGGLIILQIFFGSPLTIFGFQFEWAFFASLIIIVDILLCSRKFKKKKGLAYLILFLFYCAILGLVSFVRFDSVLAFTGFAHLIRSILLFIPFVWIVNVINDIEKVKLLHVIRNVIIISSFLLVVLIIINGNMLSGVPFATMGISNKNSLGYTVICFALFLSKYENKNYIKRPISKIIWIAVLFLIVFGTKSGTAFIFILLVVLNDFLSTRDIVIVKRILMFFCLFILSILVIYNLDSLIDFLDKIKLYKIRDFLYAIINSRTGTLDTSNQLRFEVQLKVLSEFNLDMAIGRFYYYYFAKHGYTAHQQYLQILYDTGVLGISLFLGFVFSVINESKAKVPVILIFLYSFIENFLIQFIGLIILGILITEVPVKEEKKCLK